jgi:hypothetical protein
MNLDELYSALKAKVTGQVINGTLTGVLLESELKEVYEQTRSKSIDIAEVKSDSGE